MRGELEKVAVATRLMPRVPASERIQKKAAAEKLKAFKAKEREKAAKERALAKAAAAKEKAAEKKQIAAANVSRPPLLALSLSHRNILGHLSTSSALCRRLLSS